MCGSMADPRPSPQHPSLPPSPLTPPAPVRPRSPSIMPRQHLRHRATGYVRPPRGPCSTPAPPSSHTRTLPVCLPPSLPHPHPFLLVPAPRLPPRQASFLLSLSSHHLLSASTPPFLSVPHISPLACLPCQDSTNSPLPACLPSSLPPHPVAGVGPRAGSPFLVFFSRPPRRPSLRAGGWTAERLPPHMPPLISPTLCRPPLPPHASRDDAALNTGEGPSKADE